jgi:hypothetical protein
LNFCPELDFLFGVVGAEKDELTRIPFHAGAIGHRRPARRSIARCRTALAADVDCRNIRSRRPIPPHASSGSSSSESETGRSTSPETLKRWRRVEVGLVVMLDRQN